MRSETVTDAVLIERFTGGCEESFEELISRYETKAYNLALRLTRNELDAEEVLQDVFVTVYRKIESFEGKSKFSSWLYRITVNAAFMKLRKRKKHQAISIDEMLPQLENQALSQTASFRDKCDSRALCNEMRGTIEDAIRRLPEEYRAVFVLRDIDGLSNKEVGELLNLSIPAVKSRLHRSRLMLRKRLSRFYEDYRSDEKIISVGPSVMKQAA